MEKSIPHYWPLTLNPCTLRTLYSWNGIWMDGMTLHCTWLTLDTWLVPPFSGKGVRGAGRDGPRGAPRGGNFEISVSSNGLSSHLRHILACFRLEWGHISDLKGGGGWHPSSQKCTLTSLKCTLISLCKCTPTSLKSLECTLISLRCTLISLMVLLGSISILMRLYFNWG